jgi:hypothetical protein
MYDASDDDVGGHAQSVGFVPIGLLRQGWASTGPVRDVFRQTFVGAALPYYNPPSFRSMLIRHAMTLDLTPEEMKALSQNLGHSDVLTTFTSYGEVPVVRMARCRTTGRRADPVLGKRARRAARCER